MASVRNELALANAQELINVREFCTTRPCSPFAVCLFLTLVPENKRQMLREMRDQAVDVSIQLRRGAVTRPFP